MQRVINTAKKIIDCHPWMPLSDPPVSEKSRPSQATNCTPPHLNDPMPSGPGPTRSDSQTASSSWPGQQTNKPHQAMSHGLSNPHHSDHSHTDSTQTKPFQALCDVSSNVPFTLCAFFLFCIYSTCLYVLSLSVIYSCCPNIYIYSCTVCVEHPNFCCTMSIKAYSIVYTPLCI